MAKGQLPGRAQVVVIGGGVMGASTAYHLAKRGWSDVLLLEQNTLTSGTTWHAAGLVTHGRSTHGAREIVTRSLEIFTSLEAETGFSTGFVETGTVHVATTSDRMTELRHWGSAARTSGVEVELLGQDEVVKLHPLVNPDGIVGGLLYPHDGRGNATDTTMSLARGASQRGVRVVEGITVTDLLRKGRRVTGVRTTQGDVETECVVNATGMWGRDFGAADGVNLPIQALAHYYVVTDEIPGLQRGLPTLKSSDEYSYVKDESGALMVGFFEPGSYPWSPTPGEKGFVHLREDWDHLGPYYERMIERLPVLRDAGIRLHFSGPEAFTPDGLPYVGRLPHLDNYFVSAGWNSSGFMSGPGAGSVLADWIVDGRPPFDIAEFDPARVQPHETNLRFLESRAVETLDLAYDMHWPFQQRTTARGLRRSALHHATAARGAVFGELMGWERPNWYAVGDEGTTAAYSYGKPHWFERSAQEHEAVRTGVGIFDLSSFGKFLVQGADALAVMQRVCANDVDVVPGRLVYTQWLNEFGGIVADVTVTRIAEGEFLVLSGPATARRDFEWLRAHLGDWRASVADVSGSWALATVMGPRSRELLARLTSAELGSETFPFGSSRLIDLGMTSVRATRVTFVGELGWELLIPAEYAEYVIDALTDAGSDLGVRMAGYYALNSLRLEKAYRSWGHDIGPHDTPLEAGLGFAVAWDKPGGFVGEPALRRQRELGVSRRLVQLRLDDPEPHLFHDEPVYRDGVLVGRVASAAYGHTLGGATALAWVESGDLRTPRAWFAEGTYEVESGMVRYPATASLRPLYDPSSERPKS